MQVEPVFPTGDAREQASFGTLAFHGNDEQSRIVPMTVCIGAICENRRAAVLASDRMVTVETLCLEYDGVTKTEPMSNRVLVASSGTLTDSTSILARARDLIGSTPDA